MGHSLLLEDDWHNGRGLVID